MTSSNNATAGRFEVWWPGIGSENPAFHTLAEAVQFAQANDARAWVRLPTSQWMEAKGLPSLPLHDSKEDGHRGYDELVQCAAMSLTKHWRPNS